MRLRHILKFKQIHKEKVGSFLSFKFSVVSKLIQIIMWQLLFCFIYIQFVFHFHKYFIYSSFILEVWANGHKSCHCRDNQKSSGRFW